MPRTSSRVRGHGSGPSAACRPFWEPSSTAGAASELARRRADRSDTDFASRRGRRRGSVATGAGRRWPAGRSRSRQVPPARPRSSRGDGRTVVIPTSRRAADVVAGPLPRARAVGGLQAVLGASRTSVALAPKPPLYLTTVTYRQKMQKRSHQRIHARRVCAINERSSMEIINH